MEKSSDKTGSNSILYNSYIFHTRIQYPQESFADFVNNVTELASYCDFEAKNRMIRDQIIVGMRNLSLRYEVFKLGNPTLENLLDYLKSVEVQHTREPNSNKENNSWTQQAGVNRESENVQSSSNNLESHAGISHLLSENENSISNIHSISIKEEVILTEDEDEQITSTPLGSKNQLLNSCQSNNLHVPVSSAVIQNKNVSNHTSSKKSEVNSNNQDKTANLKRNVQTIFACGAINFVSPKNCKNIEVIELDDSDEEDANANKKLNESTVKYVSQPNKNSTTIEEFQEHENQVAEKTNCANFCSHKDVNASKKLNESTNKNVSEPNKNSTIEEFQENENQVTEKTNRTIRCSHKKNSKFLNDDKSETENEEEETDNSKTLPKRKTKKRGRKYTSRLKKSFDCEICNKTLSRPDILKKHLLRHKRITGIKFHECPVCKKKFSKISILNVHMTSHTNEYLHKCYKCNKAYKYKASLLVHLKRSCSKRFKCNVCSKTFKRQCTLSSHSKVHKKTSSNLSTHSDVNRKTSSNHVCNVCGKGFEYRCRLQYHSLIHNKKVKCNFCEKKFATKYSLYSHIKIHLDINTKQK